MGKVKEGFDDRGSWCGIRRIVGISLFGIDVVGAVASLESTAGAGAIAGAGVGADMGTVGVRTISGRAETVVSVADSSTPVAARRLVMVTGTGTVVDVDVEKSVGVGCGCGATLERPLCPPTVGSQPLVGESTPELPFVRWGLGEM